MTKFLTPVCWAAMMIVLALLARVGWADRDAVVTLLLIMPVLAVVSMRRGGCCAISAREV